MNKYEVTAQNERVVRVDAENMHRDGDWIMLTKTAPQMEMRRIDDPENVGGFRNISVATGRMQQLPIAYFYKPISVTLIEPAAKEPSNGNDA